jgi:uncharacterized transporter YbjL
MLTDNSTLAVLGVFIPVFDKRAAKLTLIIFVRYGIGTTVGTDVKITFAAHFSSLICIYLLTFENKCSIIYFVGDFSPWT